MKIVLLGHEDIASAYALNALIGGMIYGTLLLLAAMVIFWAKMKMNR